MSLDHLYPNGQVMAVVPYEDLDGSGPVPLTDYFSIELDYAGGLKVVYIGRARPGSSKATAVWQICKCSYDGLNNLLEIIYANGSNAFNQIWNNRAGLTYS